MGPSQGTNPSHVTISIDGQELDDFSEGAILEKVVVRQELNEHWWCEVVCRQTEDQRFPFEDALGKPLKASTFDASGVENVAFTGFVLESQLDYEVYGSYTIHLVGVTKSYKLDLTPRQGLYYEMSMADVTQKLVSDAGLSVDGALDSKPVPFNYVQHGETDFDFIKRMVDDAESWMRPTENGIEVENEFQPGAELQWRGEDDGLVSFRARGRLSQPSMNGAHYDSNAMESRVYSEVKDDAPFYGSIGKLTEAVKSESADLPPGYIIQRSRKGTLDQYEDLLKKESRRSIGSAVTCSGVSRNLELLPGNEVEIQGVLDANGTYGVIKVIHTWNPDGYSNKFWCTPWKKYTNPKAPQVKPWFNVVPARVVDSKDEFGQAAVVIQFFWQENNHTAHVRMMTPHAGADRGFYFVPEIGDEVWVTFEDGDPERPRILGCAWNGHDKAPTEDFWGGDVSPNDVKRIVSKSGHRIAIVDKDGKETISLATPKHVKVMLTESSNETGGPTLSLHSDGDIVITAGGRIHLQSAFYSREVG
jgi:uncharacterized protein involved in type VI secretion and phage assembly